MEEPKRKAHTKEIIRELFAKSGNRCAFPGCTHLIIDEDGTLVGEICHIEAAAPGGERFNPRMTNEERAHVSNLMLMCHAHHVKTNDTEVYAVKKLKEMKRKHEAKYLGGLEKIWQSITDHTELDEPHEAKTLARLNEVMEWSPSEEDAHAIAELNEVLARLSKVPETTREFLLHCVNRADDYSCGSPGVQVLAKEIALACHLPMRDVWEHDQILQRHGITYHDDDFHGLVFLRNLSDGEWAVWNDLREFCERSGIPLRDIIVDLRFDLLD